MECIIRLYKAENYETCGNYPDKKKKQKLLKERTKFWSRTLQRSDPEFIKTIWCIRDSYCIFLGTTIQLDDVVKMSCDSDNVLCIDATYNLCSSWVTDSFYNNDHLKTNEGKHPIFLGPTIVHFEKDVFLFSCFASEILTHQSAINSLKTIRTDLEKAISNGFLSQIKDLKLLLCFFHLQQNDKGKVNKGGGQAINTI